MAPDRFAVEGFIILDPDFFTDFAGFIGKGSLVGVVVFAEKRQNGIDILFASAVDPLFDNLPSGFSLGCLFYIHASLREIAEEAFTYKQVSCINMAVMTTAEISSK